MLIKVSKLLNISEEISDCISSSLTANYDVLCIQKRNGDLNAFPLTDSSRLTSYVVCKDVFWHKVQEEGVSSSTSIILVGSTFLTWNFYRINFEPGKELEISLDYTWDQKSVQSLKYAWISSLDTDVICESDIQILAFRRNKVIICLQNRLICTVDAYPGRSLDTRTIFSIGGENEPAICVKLTDKYICTLDYGGQSISFYDTDKGTISIFVQLNSFNIPKAANLHVAFSSVRVIIEDCDHNVYSLKIPREKTKTVTARKASLVTAFKKQLSSKPQQTQVLQKMPCEKLLVSGCLSQVIVEDLCVFMVTLASDGKHVFHVSHFKTVLEFSEQLVDPYPLLIKPVGHCCLPVIVANNSLYVPSVGLTIADFVKKVMQHSGGLLAEHLSQLNDWEDLRLDKDILFVGVKNRQLDTINFFLERKDAEFRKAWSTLSCRESALKEWMAIVDFLEANMKESINDNTTRQFTEQLLQMILKSLLHLLAFTLSKGNPHKDRSSATFSDFIIKFRVYLKRGSITVFTAPPTIQEPLSDRVCNKWATLGRQAILDDAIVSNHIPLAQWYIAQHDPNDLCLLPEFQRRARILAHLALQNGDLKTALAIILNTGLSVNEVVQELFSTTSVSSIRILLGTYLESKKLLQSQDRKDLEYLALLEKLYPDSSLPQTRFNLERLPLKELPPGDLQDWQSNPQGQFTLVWIREWSSHVRQVVLVPSLLKEEYIPARYMPAKEVVWEYLLESGNLKCLLKWIACCFEIQRDESQDKKFPFGWIIDSSMINNVLEVDTPLHVREAVLNALARHGWFCHEERESIQSLLRRLGTSGVLLNGPHFQVQKRGQGSTLSLGQSDFNHRVVHYCLKNFLENILYYFIRNNGRGLQFSDCAWCRVPLMTTTQLFCQWEKTREDQNVWFQTILSSAQLIYSLKQPGLPALCQEPSVPSSLVAAALLYCPQPTRIRLLSSGQNRELLEKAIEEVPFLRPTFLRFVSEPQQDVNVYNLLLDNCVFDPRRLFGWQTTNSIKTEEAPSELPHFSHEYWVQKYGLNRCLDVSYYLMEGRPNYAYLKFLAKELYTQKTLNPHRIEQASFDACILALRHYTSSKVSSACIMFLELLGQNSFSLRMHLQVAAALHPPDDAGPNMEIIILLESALKNPASAQEAAEALDALVNDLHRCFLLVAFCQHHQLNIIPNYLTTLARSSDWLSLLSLAQVLHIPLDQMLKLICEIPDECLVEHLMSALQVQKSSSKKVRPKEGREPKDMRNLLYSRMGLLKTESPRRSSKPGDDDDQLSLSSDDGSMSDSSSFKGVSGVILQPRDLMEQLLCACNTSSPGTSLLDASIRHRNPHLCLIAASLTQTVTLYQSFCCWLVSSLDVPHSVLGEELVYSAKEWTLQDLSRVLTLMIQRQEFKALQKAFWLFDPFSSLLRLMDFLHSFWVQKEYRSSTELLEKFRVIQTTSPVGKIGQSEWIAETCVDLINASLISSSNAFEQKLFLEVLSQANLDKIFEEVEGVADFSHLHQLLECVPLVDLGKVDLPILGLMDDDPALVDRAVENLIGQLQSLGRTDQAERLGQLAEIPTAVVLLSRLTEEAKALCGKDINKRLAFWSYCNQSLAREPEIQDKALHFFKLWSNRAKTVKERYTILSFVNEWFSEPCEEQEEWEQEMWRCCVDCEVERQKEDNGESPYICSSHGNENTNADLQWECWEIDDLELSGTIQIPVKNAVEKITSVLLNQGRIGNAWKIARIHHFFTIDLLALLTCLRLARNQIEPREILEDFWEAFLERNCGYFIEDSRSEIGEVLRSDNRLDLIEKMCSLINCGKDIARQILNHYKVSLLLVCGYMDVASDPSPVDVLDRVLNSDSSGKYTLAKEVVSVHHLTDDLIVDYLYNRITSALTNIHSPLLTVSPFKLRSRSISVSSALSWTPETSVSFQLLLRLCQDPARLGHKLLNSIHVDEEEPPDTNDLSWNVSACVYSHECFTACMHMEGISKLLRKARKLTVQLAQAQDFHLMVRLLTGIGRYSEMTYIFDLLRENAQFELLLKKGMEELPMLRLALLHYLKKHHMSDRDIHSMLALKFNMFREIAEMLEGTSQEKVSNLSPHQDLKELLRVLEVIMQDFEAAAKSYIQASCFRRAQNCARQAQLVAVQLHLLSIQGGHWVLSLDTESACKFVITHKNFLHSYVVYEAYGLSTASSADLWEQALQVHVLERGDWDYLAYFKSHLGLNDTRIQGLAQRYIVGSNREVQKRMQRILNQCRDITVRYQLAQQLEFRDMCSELLQAEMTGAYLKDTLQTVR